MKNLQSVLLLVLTVAVGVLFFLHFSGKKGGTKDVIKKLNTTDSNAVKPQDLRVAYIDLDTLQKYYEYFKLRNDEIDRERQRIENEIQNSLNKLEKDRVDFLKKGQAITQIEAEKFQQEYQNRYQQLQVRQQTLQNQHLEKQSTAIEDIQKRIDSYLKEFNQTAKYSFIFSTGANNPTLYLKDSAFNITPQIIKGLNEAYQLSKKK
jgi:outer membrane protein